MIFAKLGPSIMQNNSNFWTPYQDLAPLVERISKKELGRKYPNSKFSRFRLSSASVDTLLLQLHALKLIEVDEEKKWQLTPYGDNYLVSLLGVKKGHHRAGG